jgi:uncharacterized membrane protein YkoI
MKPQSIAPEPATGGTIQPFSPNDRSALRKVLSSLLGAVASAVVALALLSACPDVAQGARFSGPETRGGPMSLDRAAEQVRQSTGGRVLGAETIKRGDRVLYRIKVLTRDGQVRYVYVEADARR